MPSCDMPDEYMARLWQVHRLHYWTERQRRTRRSPLPRRAVTGAPRTRLSRHLCLTAVTLAFVGGILVGILLPGYVPTTTTADSQRPPRRLAHEDPETSSSPSVLVDDVADPPPAMGRPAIVSLLQPRPPSDRRTTVLRLMKSRLPPDSAAVVVNQQRPRRGPLTPAEWPRVHPTRPEQVVVSTTPCLIRRRPSSSSWTDGVFWNERAEALLPKGFEPEDTAAWTEFSSSAQVIKVVEGCGRMQNRLLVFENGSKSCCRYRQNNDQIQGEIFSFHLGKLLGLNNLPPASLGLIHGNEQQWTAVRGQLTLAQWNQQKPVVMTKFVEDLEAAYIPRHFRSERRRLHPVAEDLDAGLSHDQLVELVQWSDLVVFDYLTANLDRVVNNMYNKQWNPDMMAAPAHNLAREPHTGLLIFLDNESGLLHGYRLLDKYESYHRAMLHSLCVFRRSTVNAVRNLVRGGDVGARLQRALADLQPGMTDWLPPLPDKSVKTLHKRLQTVDEHMRQCERRYVAVVDNLTD